MYPVDIAWIAVENFHELLLFLFLMVLRLFQSKRLPSGESTLYLQETAVGSGQMGVHRAGGWRDLLKSS